MLDKPLSVRANLESRAALYGILGDAFEARLSELALRAHKALGLGDYSRIDFILDEEKGDFYCLEANTLPGMTPTSLLPQMAAAVGLGYTELCEKLCELAMKKG